MQPATYTIKRLYIAEWNVTLTFVIDEYGAYCVVREICGVLGISSVKDQITKLKRRKAVVPYIKKFVLPTNYGDKETNCLHLEAVSFWMALIDPERVRPEFEMGLVALQGIMIKRLAPLLQESGASDESKIIYLAERLGKTRDITLREVEDEDEDNDRQPGEKGDDGK